MYALVLQIGFMISNKRNLYGYRCRLWIQVRNMTICKRLMKAEIPCLKRVRYLFLAALVMCSCRHAQKSDLIGTYVYRLPNGAVEVLKLSDSDRLEHELFPSVEGFLANTNPSFREAGSWEYRGDLSLHMSSIFDPALPNPEKLSTHPRRMHFISLVWEFNYDGRAAIVMNDEMGYILYRIAKPEEIREIHWKPNPSEVVSPEEVHQPRSPLPLHPTFPTPVKLAPAGVRQFLHP